MFLLSRWSLFVLTGLLLMSCQSNSDSTKEPEFTDRLEKAFNQKIAGFGTDKSQPLLHHIKNTPGCIEFYHYLVAAGLELELSGDGPFTVFIPHDSAFAQLKKGTMDNLKKPEFKQSLKNLIENHIMASAVSSDQFGSAGALKAISGKPIQIKTLDGKYRVNKSALLYQDIYTSNGIIHIIDKVMFPQKLKP
jgi:uncharacterized surface protein with fasciclin (FAS1) repeats